MMPNSGGAAAATNLNQFDDQMQQEMLQSYK